MTKNRSILACFAHPDDEAFTCGGTLAEFASEGDTVSLVCATRGEVGEISNPALATPETLGEVREQELRGACDKLGINPPIFLDYRDSGMDGTAENNDPRAFMNAPAEKVIPQLVGYIRQLQPQIILTFDPSGGYGHPDHIAIHHHTMAAFDAAADSSQFPELGEPWQSDRLYYIVLARSFFEGIYQKLVDLGEDVSQIDRFRDSPAGWPDEEVSLMRDVSAFVETKWKAFYCHQTQINPKSPFRKVPDNFMKQLIRREYFVLAKPTTLLNQTLKAL